MASPKWWTWAWVGSRSWWWTGKSGVLQSTGMHSWTWLSDWTELKSYNVVLQLPFPLCHQKAITSQMGAASSTGSQKKGGKTASIHSQLLPMGRCNHIFDFGNLWDLIVLLIILWLDGRVSEWTPGVGDGQGGLVCCDSWDRKESDMTEWLNWAEWGLINTVLEIFSNINIF